MPLNLDTPKIFPSNVISGFTKANFGIDETFKKGLSFRFSDEEFFAKSIQILADFLGVKKEQFKIPIQSHSDKIEIVDRNSKAQELDIDGLITQDPLVILGSKSADCCIVLLFDPIQKVIASIHSGRVGTEKQIVKKAVQKMVSEFNSKPQDILAYLSTSASKEMYPVYESKLINWPKKYLQKYSVKFDKTQAENLYFVDIKSWIKDQLLEENLNLKNIEISRFCSIKDEGYHSYRKDRKNFGLALGFIGTK
jgi:polyphenol oxidase